MSEDVKLLPLPIWVQSRMLADAMQAYARANMEPLIDENEALRTDRDSFKQQAEHNLSLVERLRGEVAESRESWRVQVIERGNEIRLRERAEARAERLAEALSLLPDEIGMIEHNPDEGMYMSCCGREVKSRGLYDLLMSHDDDCWYVRMQAMREQEDGNG